MNYNKHVGVPLVGTLEQSMKSLSKGQPHGIANKGQPQGIAPTQKHNRRSIRLPHYDYSRAGYYFVTITTQNREHLFGEIIDDKMGLNMAGEMVHKWYEKLEEKFPTVKNDMMVIMPNHIHFIVQIQSCNPNKGRHTGLPLRQKNILAFVGANPCVRPLESRCVRPFAQMVMLIIKTRRGRPMCLPFLDSKGIYHAHGGIQGQTHGSAPTGNIYVILGKIFVLNICR